MKPETCDIGFKEWAGICHALTSGAQSIILRKGGIDEVAGPGRFAPRHSAFWLFPTRLHESQQGLREDFSHGRSIPRLPPDKVPISTFAVARPLGWVEDETLLESFREFHVWTDDTVRKRFHYRSPGLWVLALRAYTRDTPYVLEVTAEQEGCKSWVPLGLPLSTGETRPVIGDDEWMSLEQRFDQLLKRDNAEDDPA